MKAWGAGRRRRSRSLRSQRLIAIGVDPKGFAARYGLVPATSPCQECGRERTTTVPFARGQVRGLIAPRCVCGHFGTPRVMVRLGGGIPSPGDG